MNGAKTRDIRFVCMRFGLLIVLTVFGAGSASAQSTLSTGFERDVNRYRWSADAFIEQDLGAWRFSLNNLFRSDAFILLNDRLSFRDENLLRWTVERPVSPVLSARAQGRSLWYTQSRVFSQEVLTGLRYSPGRHLWMEPRAGMAWDQRPGIGSGSRPPLRMDLGPAFGGRFAFRPAPINQYEFQVSGDALWQVLNPRRGRAVRLGGAVERTFEDTRVSTSVQYGNVRRDAYQAVSFLNRNEPTERQSETIEATASDTLTVGLLVETPFYRGTSLIGRVDFGANNRFIHTLGAPADALFFDTAFNRRALEGEVGLGYDTSSGSDRGVLAHVAARGGAEIERRRLTNREDLPPTQASQKNALLQQADYDQGFFALHARTRAHVGRFVLSFNGRSSILRHDTPGLNRDDRDELSHNGQAGVLVRLNRQLQTDVRLLGSFYHTVFLDEIRSAENNIQRSLRFRPTVHWTPSPRTRFRLSSEIRATYTVRDFVLPGRRATDHSARELRYEGEMRHELPAGLTVLASGSYSDLHLGRLLWEDFAEIPFDTLRTYSGWLRLQIRTASRVTADVGLRFFVRSDYDRGTTVRFPRVDEDGVVLVDEAGEVIRASISRPGRSWIEQIGPTCSVAWPMQNASTLRLDGWLNIQRVRQRLYGDLPEPSANAIRAAARRGTRMIIPNLALTVDWRL